MRMRLKRTHRGFAIYGEMKDSYNNKIRVQESSSVDPHCWIFCDGETDGQLDKATGTVIKSAPHLTVKQAKNLVKYLNKFIEHQENK
jgi:hypothetical protein